MPNAGCVLLCCQSLLSHLQMSECWPSGAHCPSDIGGHSCTSQKNCNNIVLFDTHSLNTNVLTEITIPMARGPYTPDTYAGVSFMDHHHYHDYPSLWDHSCTCIIVVTRGTHASCLNCAMITCNAIMNKSNSQETRFQHIGHQRTVVCVHAKQGPALICHIAGICCGWVWESRS